MIPQVSSTGTNFRVSKKHVWKIGLMRLWYDAEEKIRDLPQNYDFISFQTTKIYLEKEPIQIKTIVQK